MSPDTFMRVAALIRYPLNGGRIRVGDAGEVDD